MDPVGSNSSGVHDDRAVLVRLDVPAATRPPGPPASAGAEATGQGQQAGHGQGAAVLAALLFELGATGIEERDGPEPGSQLLLAGFPNRAAADAALARLDLELGTVAGTVAGAVAGAVVEVPPDTWFDGWRAYARVHRAGKRLVIHPPWVPLHQVEDGRGDRPGDLVLAIDPGRAFGSGAHPTTRLVLAELERLVTPVTRMLDLGCGSGVLAIAAARLGAAAVLAVDHDPLALAATRANQVRNQVRFPVTDALPEAEAEPRFELLAANIGANVLIHLAPRLVALGRVLVLSGFFDARQDEVLSAYEDSGAELARISTTAGDGWVALTVTAE